MTIRQRKCVSTVSYSIKRKAEALQVEQDVPESLWKDCDAPKGPYESHVDLEDNLLESCKLGSR